MQKVIIYALIAAVLVLAGILVFQKPDRADIIKLEQERDGAIRARDSVIMDNLRTQEENEVLRLNLSLAKDSQHRAERRAAKSQNALLAAQKAKPLPYSDVQIDSTLQAWYPE